MGAAMHSQPHANDSVGRWFEGGMAVRLEEAGLPTLAALAHRINQAGPRWWYPVRGLGATKADRVTAWLRTHEASTGMTIATDAPRPASRRQNPASLNATVCMETAWLSPSTTLRPLSSSTT